MSVCEKNGPPGVNRWLAAYTIVHGVEASPVERTAAGELQRYLETITGIRLPVTDAAAPPSPCEFLIGRTGRSFRADVAGLTDDGFAVRRCGGLTAIEGTCGRSTLYGVYYFLETYGGCRFYARDCEVLPSPGAFRLPDAIDDRCSPALSFRDVDWFEAHDAAFAAKLRINSDHNRVNNAAYGKTMHYAGDRFVHTFSALLPPEPWFESHPEYFALREDGERDRGALCLSHPEVVRLLTRGALDALEADPAADILSVSQNDNPQYCHCPACQAVADEEGSQAGPLIRAVNAVAAAVAQRHPHVLVDTLAYMYSRKPCRTKPADNVIVRLCSFECEFDTTLDDPQREPNAGFAADLEGWSQLTNRLYVWDYTTDFDIYLQTFPNFHVLQPNIQYLLRHHVTGIFEQGNREPDGEFGALRAYLLAKLLWNPEEDVQALTDGFLEHYYGKGWRHLKAYITGFEELIRELGTGATIYAKTEKLVPFRDRRTRAFLERARAWWDEAEAEEAGEQKERVKRSRLQFTYLSQCAACDEQKDTASWKQENGRLRADLIRCGIRMREHIKGTLEEVDTDISPLEWVDPTR